MRKILFSAFSLSLLFSGLLSCDTTTFAVSPGGPVNVPKDSTQQFTAEGAISWSVVGGAANGSVTNTGLYTPPSVLPANPQITVNTTNGDQTAGVTINLKTGSSIALNGSVEQISDTAIPAQVDLDSLLQIGLSNRMGARVVNSSLYVPAVWTGLGGIGTQGLESMSINLADFSAPTTFTSSSENASAGNIHVNSNGTLYALSTTTSGGGTNPYRLYFQSSSNSGESFGTPLAIDSSQSSYDQVMLASQIDAQNSIHVVYVVTDDYNTPSFANLYYTRSDDAGSSWSAPVSIGTQGIIQANPALIVDGAGTNIYVCWKNNATASATNTFFASSTNSGASFSPLPITTSNTAAECGLGMDTSGNVYLSYMDISSAPSTYGVFLTIYNLNTLSFSTPLALSSGSLVPDYNPPRVIVDSLNRVNILWASNLDDSVADNDNLALARSTNGGSLFDIDTSLLPSGNTSLGLYGAQQDISGRIHTLYVGSTDTPVALSYQAYYAEFE